MAVYLVTSYNWNDPALLSSICKAGAGHNLDFSALPSNFTVVFGNSSGRITISNGGTTFIVGEPGDGGADGNFCGTTDLDFFDTRSGAAGNDTLEGDFGGSNTLEGGAGSDHFDIGLGSETSGGGRRQFGP